VATRFYLPAWGAATASPVSPAFDAGWEKTGGVAPQRVRMNTYPLGTAITAAAFVVNGVNLSDTLFFQYVSPPLTVQTISGTVKGMIGVRETNLTDNYNPAFVARVVSNDGATFRGTLLSVFGGGTEFPITTDSTVKFPAGWTSPGTTLSSVAAQEGDRIVVDLGLTETSTSVANARIEVGDPNTLADYSETEGGTGGRPWIEFSADLVFQPVPSTPIAHVPFMR
jgi:hypothetical protein